jgi:hypothetical protein
LDEEPLSREKTHEETATMKRPSSNNIEFEKSGKKNKNKKPPPKVEISRNQSTITSMFSKK